MTDSTQMQQRYEALLSRVKTLGTHHRFTRTQLDLESFPYINLSFSSSREDLWLRQFMKRKLMSRTPGFYVDLGCNEPMGTSNTFLFYCMEWSGVCIDANLKFRDEFRRVRPRDIFINAAVSDLNKSLYFAEQNVPAGHKVARVMGQASDFDDTFFPPIEVPAMTLAEILRQHVPEGTSIDFMSVDIEDSELPALRSNDWDKYKPRVILIEAGTGFDPLKPLDFGTIAFLHNLGYGYKGSSNNNVLMALP